MLLAKKWNYDVPWQKVFVTCTQRAWALKGDGLNNNLWTPRRPQPSWTLSSIRVRSKNRQRKHQVAAYYARKTSLDNYSVSCWSDARGSYCHDSAGYALSTRCTDRGCSSYYGPDGSDLLMDSIVSASEMLLNHLDNTMPGAISFLPKTTACFESTKASRATGT